MHKLRAADRTGRLIVGAFATALVASASACASTLAPGEWQPRVVPAACRVDVTHRDGAGERHTELHFDASGRLISGTANPQYHSRAWERFEYDQAGRLIGVTSHEAREAEAGDCDVEGGCDEPAMRIVVTLKVRYRKATDIAELRSERIEYAEGDDGQYRERRSRNRTVAYSYNAAGALTHVDSPRADFSFTYRDGRPTTHSMEERGYPRRDWPIRYDAKGRISSAASLGHTYHYHYDERGRVVRRDVTGYAQFSEHYTAWTYNQRGDISRVKRVRTYAHSERSNVGFTDYRYDERGRLIGVEQGSGVKRAYRYGGACGAVIAIQPPDPDARAMRQCVRSPNGLGHRCPIW